MPAVDGFRGAAALLVLLYHCWVFSDPPLDEGVLRALVAAGALGVDLFFVISGFVLFLPVVRRHGAFGSVSAYLVRRVARIVPAYYVSLALQGLAVPALTPFPSPFASVPGWLLVLAHLLFLQHELPASLARAVGFHGGVVGFGLNGVVWSLSIEALFYLTLPLVARPFFRRPLAALATTVVATLVWRAAARSLGPGGERLLDQYPSFLAHFAFGMCAALAYVRAWRGDGRGSPTALALQVAAFAVVLFALTSHGAVVAVVRFGAMPAAGSLPGLLPALAFAVLLGATVLAPPAAQAPLTNRVARWLGDVSYGVFLWHLPLVLAAVRWAPLGPPRSDRTFLALCALVVPSSLLLGWLSRRFVEEPAIRWARVRTAARDDSHAS